MNQKLENDHYIKEETITLKIPISLPYQFYPHGFRRATGTFEYKGDFFNLVKQKIENDTLYAVCIKNVDKSALSKNMNNFEKAVNNWPRASEKAHYLINTFIKDYTTCSAPYLIQMVGWVLSCKYFSHYYSPIKRAIIPTTPPPECLV